MLPPEPAVRELNCGKPIAVRPEVENENNDFTTYAATAGGHSSSGWGTTPWDTGGGLE